MALTMTPYKGQGWTDDSTPDLCAETLNAVDAGITANSNAINAIANAVVSQIVNDPNKIASMAALFAVNQTVNTINSNLASGIIQIGGTNYQMVMINFVIPTQTSTTVFDVSNKIPANATIAYCIQDNVTDSPVVIGAFNGSGGKWKILTNVTNTGNFGVRAFYLIPK